METKKHCKEIIALYKLETSIKDLYVEGPVDKSFYKNYIFSKNSERKVHLIDEIDFSELSVEHYNGLDINSNRNKLIALSNLLEKEQIGTNVKCLIDKDFDDFIPVNKNQHLLVTDFSCLEAYLFSEEVLNKFFSIGLNNFPVSPACAIDQMSPVLSHLFCLRLIRTLDFPSAKLLKLDNHIKIVKKNGEIHIDKNKYILQFIKNNKLKTFESSTTKKYTDYNTCFIKEIQHYVHGHDYLDIFYLYVNKIKNTNNFRKENFEKALYLCAESHMFERFPLFKEII